VIPDFDHSQRGEIQRIEDTEGNSASDIECSDGGKEDEMSGILADIQILKDIDYE